jgi:hypothetical protein
VFHCLKTKNTGSVKSVKDMKEMGSQIDVEGMPMTADNGVKKSQARNCEQGKVVQPILLKPRVAIPPSDVERTPF